MLAPESVYQSSDLVPVIRELFSQYPGAMKTGPETLVRMLYALRFIPYRPAVYEVEEALEALYLEDGLAA